jgi:hypothetical protein
MVCSGILPTAYDGLGDAGFLKTSAGGVGGQVCLFSTLGCYQNKKCKLIYSIIPGLIP